MKSKIFRSPAGAIVQTFDEFGFLDTQQCVVCRRKLPAFKFPDRDTAPTGHAIRCNTCKQRAKRQRRAMARREAYAAAQAQEAQR